MQSNATLNDYMTLPADEWITLDDEFIERLPVGNGINEVGYRFTVPLKAMMQVDLTATCDVFVNIDASKRQLRFEAKGARLVTGDEDEDDGKIVQVVGPNGTFVPQKLPANFSKSIQASDMRVSFVTLVDWVEKGDGGMWGKGATESKIDMKTDVNVGLTFPPPLSFLPGFMLRQAGGLILKAASAAVTVHHPTPMKQASPPRPTIRSLIASSVAAPAEVCPAGGRGLQEVVTRGAASRRVSSCSSERRGAWQPALVNPDAARCGTCVSDGLLHFLRAANEANVWCVWSRRPSLLATSEWCGGRQDGQLARAAFLECNSETLDRSWFLW